MTEAAVLIGAVLIGLAIPEAQKRVRHRRWQKVWDARWKATNRDRSQGDG